MKEITVLIVDDSALIRKMFSDMLNSEPDIEVVGTATDPLDAREKIKQLNPRVLTLDIEMPKMDGLAFLEKIMDLRPMPVIMASTLTQKGATVTLKALEMGAVDYVFKFTDPNMSDVLDHLKAELISKVRIAANARVKRRPPQLHQAQILSFTLGTGPFPVIAIGSSTGGVEALRDIFLELPANCPPIVITQHMPLQFTSSFAARLNGMSQVRVAEAENGMRLMPGHAILARGDQHLRIGKMGTDYVCRVEDGPLVSGHRPSVDVLFDSVADCAGPHAIGVILTGMGKDGAQGLLKMKRAGAYTVGQSEDSCIVYGMPRAAAAIGAVEAELPLGNIASHILQYCEQRRRNSNAV